MYQQYTSPHTNELCISVILHFWQLLEVEKYRSAVLVRMGAIALLIHQFQRTE